MVKTHICGGFLKWVYIQNIHSNRLSLINIHLGLPPYMDPPIPIPIPYIYIYIWWYLGDRTSPTTLNPGRAPQGRVDPRLPGRDKPVLGGCHGFQDLQLGRRHRCGEFCRYPLLIAWHATIFDYCIWFIIYTIYVHVYIYIYIYTYSTRCMYIYIYTHR